MRLGLLTGGGDCPGLNAAIRAVVRTAEEHSDEIIGFRHGWRGVVERDATLLTSRQTKGILQTGGTILGTARYHPHEHEGGTEAALRTIRSERLDATIVLGGDGTLGASLVLDRHGAPIIGIPKTIDNDVFGTDRCIGFDTAVATAAEAIDRVHTTGESHDRLMVVEVMGRSSGWLAVRAGVSAGADAICVPEEPTAIESLAAALRRRHEAGSNSSVVVVAEGAAIEGATADEAEEIEVTSVSAVIARSLGTLTGFETRLTVLGHVQRGGTPTPDDRWLATQLGIAAVDAAHAGCTRSLVGLRGEETVVEPLDLVVGGRRKVPPTVLAMARRLTVQ